MLLWLLWACAPCGTDPGSLDVEDPNGLASDEELAYAREGLADFIGWTGRDGICVQDIRMVDEIGPHGPSNGQPAGRYNSVNGNILLTTGLDSWTEVMIRHELCHALDYTDDIVDSHPGLFSPPAYAVEHYSKSHWEREGFAAMCEDGPSHAIERSYSDLCGLEPTEAERVLDDVVFAAYDPGVLDQAEVRVDWREIGLGEGQHVGALYATFDGFAAEYVEDLDADGQDLRARLRLLDTAGELRADVELGTTEEAGTLHFAPWNQGVAVFDSDDVDPGSFVVARDGTITPAPALDGGADLVWDDVVFVSGPDGIVGRDLWTGEDVDLALPEELLGESFTALIGDDEVLLVHPAGQWVGTPSTGWTPRVAPADGLPAGRAWVSAENGYFGGENVNVLLATFEDGSVALPLDVCAGPQGSLVSIDGSAWLLDHDDATDTWRVGPVTVP